MEGFLNTVVSIGKAAYDRYKQPKDVNTVNTININDLLTVPVIERDEKGSLILYGPRNPNGSSKSSRGLLRKSAPDPGQEPFYEIVVLSRTHQTLSLFRAETLEEAKSKFRTFQDALSLLLEIDESYCQQSYMQQACDCLRNHDNNGNFTTLHLASELDYRNVAIDPKCLKDINTKTGGGVTPLMLAVQKENKWMVEFLVSKGAKVEDLDNQGNSVFHYAAVTTKDICEALCEQFEQVPTATLTEKSTFSSKSQKVEIKENRRAPDPKLLNLRNTEGNTPLHLACNADKPDCVHVLLCSGADVNIAGTVEDGEFPIHTALKSSSTKCVKEIIQMYPNQLHTQVGN